jgi:hypothetical protein
VDLEAEQVETILLVLLFLDKEIMVETVLVDYLEAAVVVQVLLALALLLEMAYKIL